MREGRSVLVGAFHLLLKTLKAAALRENWRYDLATDVYTPKRLFNQ